MSNEPKFQPVRQTPHPGKPETLTFDVESHGRYVGPQKPDVATEQLKAAEQAIADADAKAKQKVDELASREFGLQQEVGSEK